MYIPFDPKFYQSGVNGAAPSLFAGFGVPDGDHPRWSRMVVSAHVT